MIEALTLTKSANVTEVVVGDTIEYTIVVNNTTTVPIDNVIVTDLLTSNLQFINGSVKLDGMPIAGNILQGVNIGSLAVDKVVTLTFEAKVLSNSQDPIDNDATAVFQYIEDGIEKTGDQTSNTVSVKVDLAELKLEKVASQTEVQLGDFIDYRVTLTNVGTIDLLNIVLTDTLSPAVELVPGSVKVDGVVVNIDPISGGLNIGSLAVGEEVTIDYRVKVISGTCSSYIENKACATYSYKMTNGGTGTKQSECASVAVSVVISSFKQMGLSKSITLPLAKPNIEAIDDVVVDIVIDDTYVVDTMRSDSNEGQMLSGYKLVIHGTLKMSIEYTALLPTQPMHSAHCEVPFSSFLILPPDYVKGSYVEVSTELENLEVDIIDMRSAMVNAIFLIIAKIN